MIKLFDSMIQPILVYGSEIWAMFGWWKNDLECIKKTSVRLNNTPLKNYIVNFVNRL